MFNISLCLVTSLPFILVHQNLLALRSQPTEINQFFLDFITEKLLLYLKHMILFFRLSRDLKHDFSRKQEVKEFIIIIVLSWITSITLLINSSDDLSSSFSPFRHSITEVFSSAPSICHLDATPCQPDEDAVLLLDELRVENYSFLVFVISSYPHNLINFKVCIF